MFNSRSFSRIWGGRDDSNGSAILVGLEWSSGSAKKEDIYRHKMGEANFSRMMFIPCNCSQKATDICHVTTMLKPTQCTTGSQCGSKITICFRNKIPKQNQKIKIFINQEFLSLFTYKQCGVEKKLLKFWFKRLVSSREKCLAWLRRSRRLSHNVNAHFLREPFDLNMNMPVLLKWIVRNQNWQYSNVVSEGFSIKFDGPDWPIGLRNHQNGI